MDAITRRKDVLLTEHTANSSLSSTGLAPRAQMLAAVAKSLNASLA